MSKKKSLDRTLIKSPENGWDRVDEQALKMEILEQGTSPSVLAKLFPWRSEKNIQSKLATKPMKDFIIKGIFHRKLLDITNLCSQPTEGQGASS